MLIIILNMKLRADLKFNKPPKIFEGNFGRYAHYDVITFMNHRAKLLLTKIGA